MLRKIDPTESQIQISIVAFANNMHVDHPLGGKVRLGSYLLKVTNEGKRGWCQGKKMKAEGLKKGVSDLFLAFPHKGKSGLWLELKSKGKNPTKEQLEFLWAMRDVGYDAEIKDSVDEGIQAIKDYVGIK